MPASPYLLHLMFEGTNGQTTTVDSSSYARAVTRQGGAVLSTDDPAVGSSSSYFPDPVAAGAVAGWNVNPSADFGNSLWLGADGWTIRTRVKWQEYSDPTQVITEIFASWFQNAFSFVTFSRSAFPAGGTPRYLAFSFRAGAPAATEIKSTNTFIPNLNEWYVIEVSKAGDNYTFKVNSEIYGSVVNSVADNYPNPHSVTLSVGGNSSQNNGVSNEAFQGWMDELIIFPGILPAATDEGVPVNGATFCTYVSQGTVRKMVTNVTGLDHLEGERVSVQADGIPEDSQTYTVVSGQLNNALPEKAAVIHVGLPYTGTIKLLKASDGNPAGTGQMKMRRLFLAGIRVFRSLGFKIGLDIDHLSPVILGKPTLPLTTGDLDKLPNTTWTKAGQLIIIQDKPQPVFIEAIITQSEVEKP